MGPQDLLDLHLTRLTDWTVKVVGRAVTVGAVVGGVLVLLGIWADSLATALGGVALGVAVAGVYLATADAPLPPEVDEG